MAMYLGGMGRINVPIGYNVYKLTKKLSDRVWDLSGYEDYFDLSQLSVNNFVVSVKGYTPSLTLTSISITRNTTVSLYQHLVGERSFSAENQTFTAYYNWTVRASGVTKNMDVPNIELYLFPYLPANTEGVFVLKTKENATKDLYGVHLDETYGDYTSYTSDDFLVDMEMTEWEKSWSAKFSIMNQSPTTAYFMTMAKLCTRQSSTPVYYVPSTGAYQTYPSLYSGIQAITQTSIASSYGVHNNYDLYLCPQSLVQELS